MTPTQRSLALLRQEGYAVGVVEKWNHVAKVRQDLWGCIDLAAIHPHKGLLFVQVTSADNRASRRHKLVANDAVGMLLDFYGSGIVELHGWGKFGAAGKRKTWQCRREVIGEGAEDE